METITVVTILIFSAILHEVMHGVAAEQLGDPTPRRAGRLTLNPLPHIDPVMSIFVPTLLILSGSPIIFGAAKPVPINPLSFKEGKKDMALVALAGPFTNILIAIGASLLIRILPPFSGFFDSFLHGLVFYNLLLGIVNLIPIPPLDGSKFISFILPTKIALSYLSLEPFGIFILFFLLAFPIGVFSLGNVIYQLLLFALKLLGV